MEKKKYWIVSLVCILFSIAFGILTNDLILGSSILLTGLLCAYFASEGKKINYLFGLINYLLMGYVSLKNNLYGIFLFYIFIFAPLQLKGFLSWNKNESAEKNVKVREFTLKNALWIIASCLIGSLLLAYLLMLIPGQQLAFLDALSNCINLCGVILMVLRFKESWWLWLVNNTIDLMIWVVMLINQGPGATMMFITSLSYLIINIYGIAKWNIAVKKGENK